MRKLITEFIGTFFLVLTLGMVVTSGKVDYAPVAVGTILICMIFAGAHISGAHYNPAVTLAIMLRGKISVTEGLFYIISQIVAAIIAAYMVRFLATDKIPAEATVIQNMSGALLAELLGTFALTYVVLNVLNTNEIIGSMFYGMSVGFTVLSMTYAFGTISGGAFNPAVAISICFMHLVAWKDVWIYFVGCFGGAAFAAIVFKLTNLEEH